MKINKNYIKGFIIDYGPPTMLSIAWGIYAIYQQPEASKFEVFAKNFAPAFFVLNWLAMRVHRTKKTVDNKERNKILFQKIDKLQEKIDAIEEKLNQNSKS